MYDSLSQEALKILEKGVKYIRKHPKKYSNFFGKVGVSWPQSFSTENKEEVEKSLKESGFDFEWGENEELKIISYPPAIVTHPITNKKGVSILFTHYINEFKTLNLFKNRYSLWARCRMKIMTLLLLAQRKELNLVNFLDHNGKEFPHFLIKELHNHFWDYSVIFPWKKNDILLLDNRVIAHGRMNVHGPRRILAILGDIYSTAKVK